jgi:hypothetical protein
VFGVSLALALVARYPTVAIGTALAALLNTFTCRAGAGAGDEMEPRELEESKAAHVETMLEGLVELAKVFASLRQVRATLPAA